MRILVVSHKYPPAIGGMQRHCYELVHSLEQNHEVEKIIHKQGPIFIFLFISYFRVLAKLVTRPRFDVIYMNDGLMGFFLTPLFLLHRQKTVVTIHGLDVVFPFVWYQWWIKNILSKASKVIAVSEGTKNELLRRGFPSPKVEMIRNGVSFKKPSDIKQTLRLKKYLPRYNDQKVLVSIGRPITRKGFSWFASKVLPHLSSDSILIIIGPKHPNPEVLKNIRDKLPALLSRFWVYLNGLPMDQLELNTVLEISNNVFQLSGLTDSEIEEILSGSDLFVMPNISVKGDFEGFGLVALEAVSSGLLCIAADIDGIPTAIKDGHTGVLVKSGDEQDWINSINELIEDDSKRQDLAKTYQRNLMQDNWDWNSMTTAYLNVFSELNRKQCV